MPPLAIAGLNQITATSGRQPRLNLADALAQQIPSLYADRSFAQQERAIDLQEDAEATRQSQQKGANLISGVGTVGQLGLVAATNWDKLKGGYNWLTGAGGDAASTAGTAANLSGFSGASATEGAAATGAVGGVPATSSAALTSGGEAAAQTGAEFAGEAGAQAAGSAQGLLGSAGSAIGAVGGGAAVGTGAGYLARYSSKILPVGKTGQRVIGGLGGAAAGAGLGLAITAGNPIGAVAGGLIGGLTGGSVCILHEAAYGTDSVEVQIARQFRDTYLSKAQLRGYYHLYEGVAQKMRLDADYRTHMRTHLTDKLVRAGAQMLGVSYEPAAMEDIQVAQRFLAHLHAVGKDLGPITRANGEHI